MAKSQEFEEGEIATYETNEEEQIRLARLRIEVRLREAEVRLQEIRGDQAGDDRSLRKLAAWATYALVVGWLLILVAVILLNSYRVIQTYESVQVALVVNATVALVGLFAVILRGLFFVRERDE